MGETRDAWAEVSERFAALGRQLRHESRWVGEEARDQGHAAGSTTGTAFKDVVAAVDRAFAALEDAVSDPATRDHARAAMVSLRDAISTTFDELGAGLRGERRVAGEPPDEPDDGAHPPPDGGPDLP